MLVKHWHRHHRPLAQTKFCIGVAELDGRICGAAIVGRLVARVLDDGMSLGVNRCVTDGPANSFYLIVNGYHYRWPIVHDRSYSHL